MKKQQKKGGTREELICNNVPSCKSTNFHLANLKMKKNNIQSYFIKKTEFNNKKKTTNMVFITQITIAITVSKENSGEKMVEKEKKKPNR